MDEWADMPAWMNELVAGRPNAAEVYRLWENVWKPELAKRDVSPDMLDFVGDPARPLAIHVRHPDKGWRSGKIEWNADGDFALLEAVRRLVEQLDE